jgi:hypothetical protein
MARDILSEFGPDSPNPQVARITKNGPVAERDVNKYQPPQGPIGIMRTPGPGHGGANLGCCGTQGQRSSRGDGSGGSPGLHGDSKGMGTNRKG